MSLDNSRAWLLVVAPVLSLAIDAALLYSGSSAAPSVGALVAFAVNTAIVVWDSRYLRTCGVDVSVWLGIFLVPVYLYKRSKHLNASQAPLVGWIVAFVVSITGSAALGSQFVTLDMPTVKQDIKDWIDQRAGSDATVRCPSRTSYPVHGTFLCTASDSTGSVTVQVRVENSSGDITWQVVG